MNSLRPQISKCEHVRSVPMDIVITLLTFGIFNLRVQYRQMVALNQMLGRPKYSFLRWLLFVCLTFGLYQIYHEYKKSTDIASVMSETNSNEGLLAILLTVFGLHIVIDAIQQSQINRFYGANQL